MINPAVDMKTPQGLSKSLAYEATIMQNNDLQYHPDKRMLGRVQIRVSTIFDGIEDSMLPWAIPEFGSQCDGASSTSGFFMVPKVGSKVLVYFQDGSPLHPKYSAYTIDETTALKESEHNYPNRVVHLFQNSCMMVVDTQSNDVFFRNPGNLNMYILGDVNLMVNGNVVEKIKGNHTVEVTGNVVEIVHGDKTVYVEGQRTEVVTGAASDFYNGGTTESVVGSKAVFVHGDSNLSATGSVVRSGARIDDNPSGGGGSGPSSPSVPSVENLPNWPVIRGEKPDTTLQDPEASY